MINIRKKAKKKALIVFGARPNYMKIAPIYRAMQAHNDWTPILLNTGQHFDKMMSDVFFKSLDLPEPDISLQIGPGTQAQQISKIIRDIEPVLNSVDPAVIIVVGDVTSTLASAIAAATIDLPIAHVEAGLRSRDWSMPEERNRILTDRLSSYLLTPSEDADDNLIAEGIDPSNIFCVGNVMIDTLDWVRPKLPIKETRIKYGVDNSDYAVVTLHRPSNVDNPESLAAIAEGLSAVAQRMPILFPIHPRTQKNLAEFDIKLDSQNIQLLPPLDYAEFMALLSSSSLIITDSGGIQEEATVLGVRCLTLRENTERPITIKYGLNQLVKTQPNEIIAAANRAINAGKAEPQRPPLWDGNTAQRILDVLDGNYDCVVHDVVSKKQSVSAEISKHQAKAPIKR
ncbi:MAG: UDP-N-acetylglucosamine 2-epimerase (non-hydrolyzing) [Planctomycetes bacterium]|nr:UDP-N-acetylglucosamine 2-epimerase (non-hydrolyzing) [Planctomycetota bacterium]